MAAEWSKPRPAWIALSLASSVLCACSIVGAGVGHARDASRDAIRNVSPDSIERGDSVRIGLANGESVSGTVLDSSPDMDSIFLEEAGSAKPIGIGKREIEFVAIQARDNSGFRTGLAIGLAIDLAIGLTTFLLVNQSKEGIIH